MFCKLTLPKHIIYNIIIILYLKYYLANLNNNCFIILNSIITTYIFKIYIAK